MTIIDKGAYRKKITEQKCCVIIPTFNNAQTLATVVNDVLSFTNNVIVVNDGATDTTSEILKEFNDIEIISWLPNRGKGMALRAGIKHAQEKGFRYAITIDSDGQHFADDIPVFIDKIEQEPDVLLIGARNLNQENVPGKSSFGNKFSNFWFQFETGISLPDTQSGYRLYPIEKMKDTHYFTSKYEFEIEVLVKAAWRGIHVSSVPIKVFYAGKEKRISHFRPFKDFTRISILNTYLVILAILWYKPFSFIKNFNRTTVKSFFKKHFLNADESVLRKSTAVAFGVFMGIIPIWGYQFVSALLLAHVLKMNKAIVAVAANISVPPLIPFLLYGSLKTGQWVMGKEVEGSFFNFTTTFATINQQLVEYLIGSVLFAFAMCLVFGLVTYFILKLFFTPPIDYSKSGT